MSDSVYKLWKSVKVWDLVIEKTERLSPVYPMLVEGEQPPIPLRAFMSPPGFAPDEKTLNGVGSYLKEIISSFLSSCDLQHSFS